MLHFPLSKKLTVAAVLLLGLYYAFANVLPADVRANLPAFMSQKTINLGLDLQGGSHLVLEVDLDAVHKRAYENLEDNVRQIRGSGGEREFSTRHLQSTENGVTFKVTDNIEVATQLIDDDIRNVDVTQENGSFKLTFTDYQLTEMNNYALSQTLEILRSRVDEFGVSEPAIQRQGENRVIVELPGIEDVNRAKGIIGRTAQLSFHIVDDSYDASRYVGRRAPKPTLKMVYENVVDATGETMRIPYLITRRAAITGENLSNASSGFTQDGQPEVNISFDSRGTKKFADITTKYTGKRMAILLDGVVYSAPRLNEPILGGSASVTGRFTPQETKDLATILRAGALPAPVKFVEERTIGPSLGKDSIEAGKTAIIVGFLMVMLLMFVFYRGFGLVANVALLFNVVLIAGVMTALGATLTMPGIAGIVLTIGMAVDANVLIFERIMEETRAGRKPIAAFNAGFKSAFGTILDANITTLIVAVILFAMGSGPIKGFALTLTVGIAASMFTAIMVTRMILIMWMEKTKPEKLSA